RIHDHGHIYTLYGVLTGHERIERYQRTDDRSRPDYAKIRRTADVHVGPGEIDLVKPYEVHAEVTMGERTVALIIRSQKAGDSNWQAGRRVAPWHRQRREADQRAQRAVRAWLHGRGGAGHDVRRNHHGLVVVGGVHQRVQAMIGHRLQDELAQLLTGEQLLKV